MKIIIEEVTLNSFNEWFSLCKFTKFQYADGRRFCCLNLEWEHSGKLIDVAEFTRRVKGSSVQSILSTTLPFNHYAIYSNKLCITFKENLELPHIDIELIIKQIINVTKKY